ncbi:MAG TPA: tRNA (N(6)-L-threonylcarbamoyladenosine(37)-C(2))-methylthiotransferase MtaB [Ktedonobacter sp.]|jgi:threonylcarbamoyladenosine tRNA methylthiotransferase MtaB|nr:tRNA (N(6)-L-threonylcarbamoyladenosine(37)-C(2))-methylthiotransferase MtaB [Ktedonobacter sp.]HAG97980.1 tRNA (N(6)-L-threonylcarbamoyladenosine(37)-C(2))-methylthiotransferase MtaB [Ktedonobacter sp.]HAT46369.1 tRNA (N(6)-L-threonylcarbamoyladenosine(37)-C(2))-methylthiotransferase MtaB [Ktedonobacter sp.]HBE24188.1 tRNA (N(6)-L-threonylcarbamoyladenosine(37)-C(2))-methylthiotransferase MtaB [Ktedonobacter sp.]HCF84290.1 tRNA (N(6)-L-threonylcarbamoyladenosine(37)-C(2))-methylthiotransfer
MQEHPLSETTTFAVATLGCKVNQADSEAISEQMSTAGFAQRDFSESADVYIVNTCTVTHLGDRSSRQLISQARRRHSDALLVVTGCYAELNPAAVAALPGVDLVVGNSGKGSLAEAIKEKWKTYSSQGVDEQVIATKELSPLRPPLPMLPLDAQHIGSDRLLQINGAAGEEQHEPQPDNPARLSPFTVQETSPTDSSSARLTSRTRVQMKVQDGCDNRCTYCIVPYVRGGSRSRSIASVVEHVQRKERAGFQEIVLTGIHLGDYHPDENKEQNLGHLITVLLRETTIPRIRVSSLEPEDFRLEWLELWTNPRMCRHFHLPMQSGSDAILRRMARRYNSTRYHDIVTTAKRLIPGIAISTDIITGFPGESESDFEQTYRLARELQFAKSHVFRFSPRQGTTAARMKGQVKDEVKKARSERLLALNDEHGRIFRQQFLGSTVQVLIESKKHGYWEGLTDNYLRVELVDLPEAETRDWQNTLVSARLSHLVEDGIASFVM